MKIFKLTATAVILSLLISGCAKKESKVVKEEVKPAETGTVETYIDSQKKSIEKAQEAVDKNKKAQEEALKSYEDIK